MNGLDTMDAAGIAGSIGSILALGAGILIFVLILTLGILIYSIIVNVKLFQKAGQAGWKAIIPFYAGWVKTVDMAKCHWIVFVASVATVVLGNVAVLGTILSLASLFAYVCTNYNLAKKFGKSTGFAIGMMLLPIIFDSILAFSKDAKYDAGAETKNVAFFEVNF